MDSAQNQVTSHELRVIAMNGRAFRVDLSGVLQICLSRLMLLKLSMFSAMVALINPPLFGLEAGLVGRFFYWLAVCYFVTFLWIGQFWLYSQLRRRTGWNVPVFQFLLVGVAVVIMVWTNFAITRILVGTDGVSALSVWVDALRYFLIALVIEVVSVSFILPRFQQVTFENPPPGPAPKNMPPVQAGPQQVKSEAPAEPAVDLPETPAESLSVNGRTILRGQLRWMKSVEHYVEFHCETRPVTERAVLRDMIEQAAGWGGIQPHRSWWVSHAAVKRMAKRDGNPVLILIDGTEVPVSRHRKAAVEAWLDAGGDS